MSTITQDRPTHTGLRDALHTGVGTDSEENRASDPKGSKSALQEAMEDPVFMAGLPAFSALADPSFFLY